MFIARSSPVNPYLIIWNVIRINKIVTAMAKEIIHTIAYLFTIDNPDFDRFVFKVRKNQLI